MTHPYLLVSTPGRSGSKSAVAAMSILCWDARIAHEPLRWPLIIEGCKYAEGVIDHEWMVARLRTLTWPDVGVAWMFAPLLPALLDAFPGCEFVHLVRDRDATVRSMVRNLWYVPWEDDLPQVQYWRNEMGDRPDSWGWQTRPQDWRIRPDRLASPEMSTERWRALGQAERCGWWVDYNLAQAERHGVQIVDLADSTMSLWYGLVERSGVPPRWRPNLPFPMAVNAESVELRNLDEAGERRELTREEWTEFIDAQLTGEIRTPEGGWRRQER